MVTISDISLKTIRLIAAGALFSMLNLPLGIAQEQEPGINEFIFADEEPKPLNMEAVSQKIGYPEAAQNAGIEGQVIARILVDPQGNYVKHRIVRQPDSILGNAVDQYVSELRFTPASSGGQAIMFWVNIPFSFKLQQLSPQEQAINQYTAFLEENPDNYEAYLQRGLQYLELQEADPAIADFNESIRLNPQENKKNAEKNTYGLLFYAFYARGKAYAAVNEWQAALNDLNEALKLAGELQVEDSALTATLPSVYGDRGFAYYNMDQFENAVRDYDQALAMDSQIACAIHTLRADACLAKEDYPSALTSYDALIECQPEDRFLHYSRGFYRLEVGDFDGALADFRETYERNIDPNIRIAALNSASFALLKAQKYAEALTEVDKALQINVLNAASYYYKGQIYQAQSKKAETCEAYQNALDYGLEDSMPGEATEIASWVEGNCP